METMVQDHLHMRLRARRDSLGKVLPFESPQSPVPREAMAGLNTSMRIAQKSTQLISTVQDVLVASVTSPYMFVDWLPLALLAKYSML